MDLQKEVLSAITLKPGIGIEVIYDLCPHASDKRELMLSLRALSLNERIIKKDKLYYPAFVAECPNLPISSLQREKNMKTLRSNVKFLNSENDYDCRVRCRTREMKRTP